MFKALIFIMYVDPEDRDAYQASLKTMVELRKKYPLELKTRQAGDFDIDK